MWHTFIMVNTASRGTVKLCEFRDLLYRINIYMFEIEFVKKVIWKN